MRRAGMRTGVLLACLLALAACQAPQGSGDPVSMLPDESDLPPLPEYRLSRTNWNTSARCTVYPFFGKEEHPQSVALVGAMHRGLRESGYTTVVLPGPGYASLNGLDRANRIIRPARITFRSTDLSGERLAVDARLLVEVWRPNDIERRRLFEVRARDIVAGSKYTDYTPLFSQLASNLLSLDTFRDALQFEPALEE